MTKRVTTKEQKQIPCGGDNQNGLRQKNEKQIPCGMRTKKRSDGQGRAALALLKQPVENYARNEDCREEVGEQTEDQGDRKALDRAGTEDEQDAGGDDGGDVRVDDGDPGVGKAVMNSRCRTLAEAQLFAD